MQQIVDDPKHYERHIQRYAASVVTSVTYGRRVQSMDEWIVVENNKSMDGKLLAILFLLYLTHSELNSSYKYQVSKNSSSRPVIVPIGRL